MALDRKPVTIHYRRYVNQSGRPTLEQLVNCAMGANHNGALVSARYTSRIQTVNADNFLNNIYSHESATGEPLAFGDVVHFTRGHLQAVLQMAEPTTSQLVVAQMAAPEQSEYVHSQMFWLIKGDHVFVIQSISLQTEALEKYLAWLLSTYVAGWKGEIALASKFDSGAVGGDLEDIKELVIGGSLSGPQVVDAREAVGRGDAEVRVVERDIVQDQNLLARQSSGREMARGVLEAIMNHDAAAADRVLQAVPADAELHVQVHIGYKTRKRRVDKTSLRNLEIGLRHLPDSQLSVVAKGGVRSPDGSIRLHHNAAVKLIKAQLGESEIVGSLLDPADALRAMGQAYAIMLSDGKIAD